MSRTELRDEWAQPLHISTGLTGLWKVKADNLSVEQWLDSFVSYVPEFLSNG